VGGGKQGYLKKILSSFAASAPQVVFEMIEVFYNFYALVKLYRQNKQHRYDFIYERYALNALAASWLHKLIGLPLILEVNDATVIERSRPLVLKNMAARHEGIIFARARQLITITDTFKQLILDRYHLPEAKVLVLPNAIDPAKFDLSREERLTRSQIGIPEDSIVLGCVGAFVLWHGLEFLIDSLGDIASENELFFLFIGDGPVKDDVLACAVRHKALTRVKFTGFLSADRVPFYLDLVDICVIPGSNFHCSPMKLFEYMAMAKPVVLPKYQPLLDTITPGKEGLFFKPDDGVGLRREILKLVESVALRKDIGNKGFDTVSNNHTWLLNCERLIDEIS
jgi:glycosyltransferase involved in cell wall biosynthesis